MDVTSGTSRHVGVTPTPEFLTVNDAAKTLGLSRREVYRLLEAEELTGYPYGRKRLIDSASVKAVADRIRAGGFAKAATA